MITLFIIFKAFELALKLLHWVLGVMIFMVLLFLGLHLNVFTLPFFLLAYLVSPKDKKPKCRNYGLIFYPSWSGKKHSFTKTFCRFWFTKEEDKKKVEMHPYEEIFFM